MHNIATSKMAAVKRAGLSHDKKGCFRSSKEVEQSKHLVKISVDKSPSCDEALCIKNVCKISGRCVLELELLAEALDRGCKVCAKPLQLSNITDETVSGLGSFLYITSCNPDCGEIIVCHTKKLIRWLALCVDNQSLTSTPNSLQVCYVTL